MNKTLVGLRTKFKENGYKCRKFTNSDDGFVATSGNDWWRIYIRWDGSIAYLGHTRDQLHAIGIEYMIQREIAKQQEDDRNHA